MICIEVSSPGPKQCPSPPSPVPPRQDLGEGPPFPSAPPVPPPLMLYYFHGGAIHKGKVFPAIRADHQPTAVPPATLVLPPNPHPAPSRPARASSSPLTFADTPAKLRPLPRLNTTVTILHLLSRTSGGGSGGGLGVGLLDTFFPPHIMSLFLRVC